MFDVIPSFRISYEATNVLLDYAFFQMLLNLHKKTWMDGLTLQDYDDHCAHNQKTVTVSCMDLLSRATQRRQ